VVDLVDINFGHRGAGLRRHHAGGILTVQDGVHVAKLNLIGNYIAATFTSASDGHGGTLGDRFRRQQASRVPHS